jgi:tyrosinase
VRCLTKKPSKIDPTFAPGARTRFDDFVAVHINQTMYIHTTVRPHVPLRTTRARC